MNQVFKRLFIAIPLPEEMIRAFSGYEKEFPDLPHARWVPSENFHITVYFIGWIDEKNLPEIISRTKELALSIKSFPLKFEEIIWAPPDKITRMIWALFERSSDFENLVEKVDKSLKKFLSRDTTKESIPHVTLVRFDSSASWRDVKVKQPELGNKTFKVDQIKLMVSRLFKTGPIYSEVTSFYLTN